MNIKFKFALDDMINGILNWRIWLTLGWQDIRLRYRRSLLGPFWITISMAITIYTMGFLYGNIFKMDLQHYFPFLATGIITWALISTTISESTSALIEASNYIRQIKLPFIVFILRILVRNLIIFVHNLVVLVPCMVSCHVPVGFQSLALFPSLLIIIITGVGFGLSLGMLGARFRDINQLVASVIQVFFFLTPIIWDPQTLAERYHFIVKINPFAQFVNLVRAPLLGTLPTAYDYTITISIALIGIVFMFCIFARARHRIIYWF